LDSLIVNDWSCSVCCGWDNINMSSIGLSNNCLTACYIVGLAGIMSLTGSNILTLSSYVFFSLWVMHNLSFDWKILDSLPCPLYSLVLNYRLLNLLGYILNLSFHRIVISNGSFNWDSFGPHYLLILSYLSFDWYSFYSLNLVVLDVLSLKWDILDSALHRNLFCYCSLSY
jgi:hypothetical protein